MRPLFLIAALIAAPALAEAPVRLPDGSYVSRASWAELKTPQGRADLHKSLAAASRKVCADVRPLRNQRECEAQALAAAEARALPPVAGQLRVARQEASTVALAAR